MDARLAPAMLAALACACSAPAERPASCGTVTETLSWTAIGLPPPSILFVVGASDSMREERAALAEAIPSMIHALSSGDLDGDGAADFEPVSSFRVGVVTTDMGTGGHAWPTCERSDFGDDGVLRTQGNTELEGCAATYPNILDFRVGGLDEASFARDVACVAMGAGSGCTMSQPLEAALKALSPRAPQGWAHESYVPPGEPGAPEGLEAPFFRRSYPHGDGINDGFSHPDGMLAIVVLTDEDDCSVRDPALFDPEGPYASTDPDLRCASHPEALHSLERYVNGFMQLRWIPGRILFAPLAGVPVDLASGAGAPVDWERLTSPDCEGTRDPRLCELAPACEAPGRGAAIAPLRLLGVARELEARGALVTIGSVCEPSYERALGEVAAAIGAFRDPFCVGRPWPLEPDGRAACELRVFVPEHTGCDAEGYEVVLDEAGAEVREGSLRLCRLNQLVPASRALGAAPPRGVGWYYDDFTADQARFCGGPQVAFVGVQISEPIHFVCRVPVEDAVRGHGAPCDPLRAGACVDPITGAETLSCDPVLEACGLPCAGDDDCRDLENWVCDTRPLGELDPAHFAGDERPRGVCVDPRCG